MNIKNAAEATRDLMQRKLWPDAQKVGNAADQYDHIEWMLTGIVEGYIQGEKAHRWLGWSQAIICTYQFGSPNTGLDKMKQINHNA